MNRFQISAAACGWIIYRHTFYPMAVRWNKRAFQKFFLLITVFDLRGRLRLEKSESGTWNLFKLNSNRHFDWSIRHLFQTSGEKQVRKGRQFSK